MIHRFGAYGQELNRTFYAYDDYGVWSGMTNLIDGRCVELPYDMKYEFLNRGDTIHITCRHSGTETIAAEYELVFTPLN